MINEKIVIANLKCQGCATTIQGELMSLEGMEKVSVLIDEDALELSYDGVSRDTIIAKLLSLGYPEATAENGLLLQLKSYSSCMIGRIHNL